jgi:hypothetical protein
MWGAINPAPIISEDHSGFPSRATPARRIADHLGLCRTGAVENDAQPESVSFRAPVTSRSHPCGQPNTLFVTLLREETEERLLS